MVPYKSSLKFNISLFSYGLIATEVCDGGVYREPVTAVSAGRRVESSAGRHVDYRLHSLQVGGSSHRCVQVI